MSSLYSVAQIRAIERTSAQALPEGTLMERAGRAAAEAALTLAGERLGARVLVLAGPGNNGGDALEAAANLAEARIAVTVIHLAPDGTCSPETARALARARASTATFAAAIPPEPFSLVIDGLFGIGLARPLAGRARELVQQLASLPCPVLALDVPSGLDADTGTVVGPDGVAVTASTTITFIGDKPGLHTNEGRAHAGRVIVATLGIDTSHDAPSAVLNGPRLFARYLRPRTHSSHKGSFGSVAVAGGAHGMAGAVLLAGRAALLAGAGRVYAGFVDPGPQVDFVHPELMCRDAGAIDFGPCVPVLGPGMGRSPDSVRHLLRAFGAPATLVLDADALNLLADSADLQDRLAGRGNAILTPHPLEAARLLGMTSTIVQADRLAAAHELSHRFNATVVLKGSGTVIAQGEHVAINDTGNPALATAGTGDVLAGVCGALLAQGWPEWEAALGAVHVHGLAADLLVAQGAGPVGLAAGELAPAVRSALNALVAQYGPPR